MDGLKDTVPLGKSFEKQRQMTLFDMPGIERVKEDEQQAVPCRIFDWRNTISLKFMGIKEIRGMEEKLFDYVIGNPPYQEDRRGESNTALPVYHFFMEAVYKIANSVELITPARFLFNAGMTPKEWNSKMLNDVHLKVLEYEPDASKFFSIAEIKGGISITYRDSSKYFGAIGTFTIYKELNTILKKVINYINDCNSIESIAYVASKFNTDQLFSDYPIYRGHERRMSSNVINFDCFHSDFSNGDILIYGVDKGRRIRKYIDSKYVDMNDKNIPLYKIVIPKADGKGTFGESLTNPEVLPKNSGFTHTFLGIGGFSTKYEAESCLKYIKTKFARTLLGILKITQDVNAEKWKYVPLQDFTSSSDIDWTKQIHDIDLQLYRKYCFDDSEIEFIETQVKEME
ncbi:MAG: Eco57I restriction-modification methylase domain-containing protein, partial [Desulfovibrio sp.]|nr:Eco57I restriction-modification methylase domain-containing protein [Desulfovibrio sp.]